MTSKTFTTGTVIDSAWLNDVNNATYLNRTPYLTTPPFLLTRVRTTASGAGSRNVIQGMAMDITNQQFYALQLKDSADAFYIRKVKLDNPDAPGNVTTITPNVNLIVHQGLFMEDSGGVRYLWAGGDSATPLSLARVRESDGDTTQFLFNPALMPGAPAGAWGGNATATRNLAGTKLFIRASTGGKDYIVRYDFAAFKANSATAVPEFIFAVDPTQYVGTSFQGIIADEDTVYCMSGNTVQNMQKFLYAYSYTGVIKWKRTLVPHHFESKMQGTKSEVEGLDIMVLPTGERIMLICAEMGYPSNNVHLIYGIPQYPEQSVFANLISEFYYNAYGGMGIGGAPNDNMLFQVNDVVVPAETVRIGVKNTACVGITGGGMQMVVGSDGTANWVQRENMPATFWTGNLSRMVLAADRARLDIGLGETGPQAGGISPGYRLGLNIGALSTLDAPTTEQEILRMGWSEGSQDLGVGEGIYACFGATLNGGTFQPLMNLGISKVSNSDSATGSYGFIASSPGTGLAPIKYINWTNTGTIFPLADAQQTTTLPSQDLGSITAHWRDTFTKNVRLGAGTTTETSGTGSPEGVITAAVGSRYWREDGTTGTRLYWKATGTGATGWVATAL